MYSHTHTHTLVSREERLMHRLLEALHTVTTDHFLMYVWLQTL